MMHLFAHYAHVANIRCALFALPIANYIGIIGVIGVFFHYHDKVYIFMYFRHLTECFYEIYDATVASTSYYLL